MNRRADTSLFLTALLGLLLAGCGVRATLDRGAGYGGDPVDREVQDVPVHGHEVIVRLVDSTKVSGELLAVDAGRLWIRAGTRDRVVWRGHVAQLKVVMYSTGVVWQAIWAGLLTASMVSHGFFAFITVPTLSPAAAVTAGTSILFNKLEVKREQLGLLYQFARYPAGMPGQQEEDLAPPAPHGPVTPAPPLPTSGPTSRPVQGGTVDEPGISPR